MNKTKIEWCDYTINPVKGLCPMACPYCYARAMYKRFKWNPEIRFDLLCFVGLPNKPSRIFVGSTIELFGDWINPHWLKMIFSMCSKWPQHIFIFLTKQPQNLPKWFPNRDEGGHSNCWVGATITHDGMMKKTVEAFDDLWSPVKFISFEPLLGKLSKKSLKQISDYVCHWLIIGQQTPIRKATQPKIEWIQEIVEAADHAHIPVFLKDNLFPLVNSADMDKHRKLWQCREYNVFEFPLRLRQEFPR